MPRRFRMLPLLGAAFAFFAAGTANLAAEEGVDTFGPFHLVPGQPGTLAFEGPVQFGVAGMFLWALATTGIPERLILDSPGGSVEDALFIADVVRTRRIETEIPAGSICHSACVVIFFAGVGRQATGELGVHRFMEAGEGYTPTENALLTTIAQDTLRRLGARAELVDLAWATPFDQMHILTAEEVLGFGVNRTREEGLRLAPEEDLPVGTDSADTTLDPLELVADYGPGVTLTIRRAGQPDEIHFGAIRWEVGERQGIVKATVFVPDLGIGYEFMFGPFTSADEPYLYGAIVLTKLDANGGVPIERMHRISVAYPTPSNPVQLVQIGQAATPVTAATTILNLPRFARELDVDRFHRALAFQLSLSLDGTADNLIFVSFDVGEAGHAAFERALPAWTGS